MIICVMSFGEFRPLSPMGESLLQITNENDQIRMDFIIFPEANSVVSDCLTKTAGIVRSCCAHYT